MGSYSSGHDTGEDSITLTAYRATRHLRGEADLDTVRGRTSLAVDDDADTTLCSKWRRPL